MSTFHEEQRRQERVPFKREITLNDDIKVKAIDISKGGMYIHTSHLFKTGDIVEVSLPLRGETFSIKAKVKHVQKGVGMGIMFIDMDVGQMENLDQVIFVAKKRPRRETKKIKVLFVEDNDTSRKMLKNHMLAEGLWVIEAANGIEAIKTLSEQPVDIVVLDLFMEQMSGFKVLSIIKESPEWVDIPVIVFSAKGTDDIMDKVFDAGADHFLLKMITPPGKLVETIKTVYREAESSRG